MLRYLLLLLFSLPYSVHGESLEHLLSLSLEELLQLDVETVSKRKEPLNEAPGVVTVFTSADIQAFGARNLKDVLLRAPNFYMFDSSAFTATGSTLRAGATQPTNNHVLYLVNGRPLRESGNGGRHSDINLMFPLSAIEQIEFVRGPGSVLYGSNAFNGAINIITKKSEHNSATNANVTLGDYGYSMVGASTFLNHESGIQATANINFLSEGGANVTAFDEQLEQGSSQPSKDGYFARFEASLEGLSAEAMVSDIELYNISGSFRWENLDVWRHTRQYINLGYHHAFNSQWSSMLNFTLNHGSMAVNTPTAVKYRTGGHLSEVTINGKLSEQSDMVIGLVHDQIKGNLGIRGGQYQNERTRVYCQYDYRFTQQTKLTTGLQWNKPEGQAAQVSPRLALIHKFNDHWVLKGLYSEAFRSPYGSEMAFQSSFLKGDPELKPEIIKTSELQLKHTHSHGTIAATLYYSKTNDLIGRSRVDNTTFFVNVDQEIRYRGVELEGRWFLTPKLQLKGNASYQETKDDAGHVDIMLAPNKMMKLGLSYTTSSGVVASLWNNYFGSVS